MAITAIDSQSIHMHAVIEWNWLSDVQILTARKRRANPYHGE